MSKVPDINTSIKDFVTIIDKQIGKLKDTDPKQESKGTPDKSTMPKDLAESNKVKTPKSLSKEIHDKSTKTKDTFENTKVKTPKQQKTGSIEHDDKHKGVTNKRNASTRSPLEGNPGKEQKESKKNEETNTTNNAIDIEPSGNRDTTDIYQAHSTPKPIDGDHASINNTEYPEHSMPLHTLLEELKEIKSSIQNLNNKLDQELTTRTTDYKSLNNMITAQHDQVKLLTKTNEDLKEQNRKLQNEVLNSQTDML